MEKALKYPIKYAIMPIKDQNVEVVANIVAKCYVVGERREYLSDGTWQIKYEVTFLYTEFHEDFKPVVLENVLVDEVFNSFAEALTVADQANKEKQLETLVRYKKIEELIARKTADMMVTPSSSLEDIIARMVDSPKEFYLKLARVLSVEEREYLKQLIKNRSCSNCTNASCRIEHFEKVGLDERGKPQGSSCIDWDNLELVGRQRLLIKD